MYSSSPTRAAVSCIASVYTYLYRGGGALGFAQGLDTILANIQELRPQVLVAVPTVYVRIYDGIKTNVAASNRIRQAFFAMAMWAADARRDMLNNVRILTIMRRHTPIRPPKHPLQVEASGWKTNLSCIACRWCTGR